MIALGLPECVVLETLTDTQFADTAAKRSVIAGSVWTEDLRGTNALGLCLTTLRPAQVYGGKHFLRAHGDVSCISSPIFDMFLTGLNTILGAPFDQIFEDGFDKIAARLVQGETLRLRDRFGSAVSMRCVANRASFALAGRLLPAPGLPAPAYAGPLAFPDVVIDDPVLRQVLASLTDAVRQGRPICLIGETGTGKTTLARIAHDASRNGKPFVTADGAILAAGNAVATLFGTIADAGLLAEAAGGTLFIANLPMLPAAAQIALARLIGAGQYRHPVTSLPTKPNTLFIFGSPVPLDAAGLEPQLRYRLADCTVTLPPCATAPTSLRWPCCSPAWPAAMRTLPRT